MQAYPTIRERPSRKLPTTAVTNELARAVNDLARPVESGAEQPPRPSPQAWVQVEIGAPKTNAWGRYDAAQVDDDNFNPTDVTGIFPRSSFGPTRISIQMVVWHMGECQGGTGSALPPGTRVWGMYKGPDQTGAPLIFVPPTTALVEAIISSSTVDGANKRWAYSWAQADKQGVGYAGWTAITGGLTGTNNAFNRYEYLNGSTGQYGNGVTQANLKGTMAVKPLPNGWPVLLKPVRNSTHAIEYWFSYANGVDGGCP